MIKILIKKLKCMKKRVVKVNTNMSENKLKKKQARVINYDNNSNISEERMIEIQAEAYYRALKRIEEDKEKEKEKNRLEKEKNLQKGKDKWYTTVLNTLKLMLFPSKSIKRNEKNKDVIYNSVLIFFVSAVLRFIGRISQVVGILSIGKGFINYFPQDIVTVIFIIITGLFLVILGSIINIAGSAFLYETDNNKIFAYSASVLALISCIISIVALIKG